MGKLGIPESRTGRITYYFLVLLVFILLPLLVLIFALVYTVIQLKEQIHIAIDLLKAPINKDNEKTQGKDQITESNYYHKLYSYARDGDSMGFTATLNSFPASSHTEILSQVSPQKNTFLHIATRFGADEIEFIEKIVDLHPPILFEQNNVGDSALHIAAKRGKTVMVGSLIRLEAQIRCFALMKGEDPGYPLLGKMENNDGNSALHEAFINRHEEVAEYLIEADRDMVFYFSNKEDKSPLYLASEAGYVKLVELIKETAVQLNMVDQVMYQSKSPLFAAIFSRSKETLGTLLSVGLTTTNIKDEREMTPLHHAVSTEYLQGVRVLLRQTTTNIFQPDIEGNFPIHTASSKGYVHMIQEFLQHCLESKELLNKEGQNILHVAAKCNKDNVIEYVLRNHELEELLNQRDNAGDTPLHLAAKYKQPMAVSSLTWDKRINLNLVNGEGLTALDIAEGSENVASFHGYLTWIALNSAGACRAQQSHVNSQTLSVDSFKDRVNTLLLVTILISTVTFAAGFTMPGGYNSSEENQGMATMLGKQAFQIFVICDTMAMYISIIVAVTLIWAQLGDLNLVVPALQLSLPLLGLALTMMSLAFTAGVYVVVSNLRWLGIVVLGTGSIFLSIVSVLFIPLFFPSYSTNRIIRYITYYPFRLIVSASGNYNKVEKKANHL